MFSIKRYSIVTKIGVILVVFASLLAVCTAVALFGLRANARLVQSVLGDQQKSLYLAAIASEGKSRMHQRAYEIAVETNAETWPTLQKAFLQEVDDLRHALAELRPLMDEIDMTMFGPIQTALERYVQLEAKAYDLRIANNSVEVKNLLRGEMSEKFAILDERFDKLIDKRRNDMDEAGKDIRDTADKSSWETAGVAIAGLGLTIAISIYIVVSGIARPLSRLTTDMGRLAENDLSVPIEGADRADDIGRMAKLVIIFKGNGLRLRDAEAERERQRQAAEQERVAGETAKAEIERQQKFVVTKLAEGLEFLAKGNLTGRLNKEFPGQYEKLRADFNGTVDSLQSTLASIDRTTTVIRVGTDQIAAASDDFSRRTEQQAASLQQTASALNLVTTAVNQMAANAGQAAQVATATRTAAESSGSVVNQAVDAMDKIRGSSDRIGNIIGVIDEIAFQTNLLALNAGVEAARAGDAGKGFAVVASEVRALAQRSADAAKEIKALISASTAQVDGGVVLVGQTGTALHDILTKVAEMDLLVRQISVSAKEQAAGLTEINTAVGQMDQTVQQNAAMIEESNAAAQSLKNEAQNLRAMVDSFDIGGDPDQVARSGESRSTQKDAA
jgi:methyl-accepting chemotaxis protein